MIEPEGDLGTLGLSDMIDAPLQELLHDFYRATGMLGAILDVSGSVVVAVGWQDICTKYHRCHPDTRRNCVESDTLLTQGDASGRVIGTEGFVRDITERKRAEELLAKKLNELERFNRSMAGRELRMVELKREVNELLGAAGQLPKYRIHE